MTSRAETHQTPVPSRAEQVRSAVIGLALEHDWARSPNKTALMLISMAEAGIRVGGPDARGLAREFAAGLEAALLRGYASAFAAMLSTDAQKHIIRHLIENTTGDAAAALRDFMASVREREEGVLADAGSIIHELSSMESLLEEAAAKAFEPRKDRTSRNRAA